MSALEVDVTEGDVLIRPMLTINRAIDLYAGDLSRRGCSERTRYTYTRILGKFADRLPEALDVSKITSDDCRLFLDLYNRRADGTKCHTYTVLSAFFKWLMMTEQIKRSPTATIPRPRRRRPEDLDVVTVSGDDVRKLLAAGQTWTERLAVAIPVYLGPRRRAVAQLRLTDYDRARGRLRFQEKGGKTIWKPVPDELANLLEAAISDKAIVEPDDYLVPPEGHLTRAGVRDDRVIWRVVKRVAERAGVETHVHALRAAFAVAYLEQHPGDTYGAQQLLGHQKGETTQVYLRKLDKDVVMERVRGLSWDDRPESRDSARIPAASDRRHMLSGRADLEVSPQRGDARGDEPPAGSEGLSMVPPSTLTRMAATDSPQHDDLAALRAEIAALQSRLATAEAANQELAASGVVGAGGFEPPQSDSPVVDRGCGTDLVVVLDDEARLASDQATREVVS